ncbi:DUF2157 domain-containing protein [Pelagicoccus sp. SDUM812003]|uniref:DUF2157 domain-containing protein n=1 Tax=Pelagicoccus sp. SDUM812003 TaxID=3041267 RepID=UPI00280E5EFD|nr:DUF2157 domain-containing protein [Pelagicoccus sp. SDUM812003]MDQ8204440.1 DUF2157 domain-containing protein [Pelagicoccus sp. SDUM812003]
MSRSDPTLWLHKEIPKWQRAGIIDPATAERLRASYPLEDPERNAQSTLLIRSLATVGSLLIGLGIILIFAYNWDHIAKTVKLGLAFTPLSICFALAIYALRRRPDSVAWRESLGVSTCLCSAACIGLVGQTLQVQSNLSQFYFFWQLSCLPLLWAFHSRALYCLLCFLSLCWATSIRYDQFDLLPIYFAVAQGALLVYLTQERRHLLSKSSLLFFAVSTCWTFTMAATRAFPFSTAFLWLTLGLALFYLIGSSDEKRSDALNPTAVLSKLALTACGFILSFEDAWELTTYREASSSLTWIIVALACGAYLFVLIKQIREKDWYYLPWASIPLIVALGLTLAAAELVSFSHAALFLTPYMGSLGVLAIFDGYRNTSIARLNHGLLIVITLAILRFFDGDMGMLARGIGFIVIGILFLATNIHFIKRSKEAQA